MTLKLFAVFLLTASAALALSGCETVKGVGRDIEGASSSVQKAISSKSR